MKPSNMIIVSTKYIEEKEHQIADLSKTIERLQEQLDECEDALYEYIQIHGVERKCSKYLAKYAKRTK